MGGVGRGERARERQRASETDFIGDVLHTGGESGRRSRRMRRKFVLLLMPGKRIPADAGTQNIHGNG
jgi:hypothetical protein